MTYKGVLLKLVMAAMAAHAQECDDNVKVWNYTIRARDGASIDARAYAPGGDIDGVEQRTPTAADTSGVHAVAARGVRLQSPDARRGGPQVPPRRVPARPLELRAVLHRHQFDVSERDPEGRARLLR